MEENSPTINPPQNPIPTQEQTPTPPSSPISNRPKLKLPILIACIVIFLLVIGGVSAAFFMQKSNNNSKEQTEVAISPQPTEKVNVTTDNYQNQKFDGTIYIGQATLTNKSDGIKTFHGDWFTFDFPEGWLLDGQNSSGTSLLHSSNNYDLSGTEFSYVTILINTHYESQVLKLPKAYDQEPILLDNIKAIKYSINSSGMYYKIVEAEYGSLYFSLSIGASSEQLLNKYEPVFTSILNSFKFTDFADNNLN